MEEGLIWAVVGSKRHACRVRVQNNPGGVYKSKWRSKCQRPGDSAPSSVEAGWEDAGRLCETATMHTPLFDERSKAHERSWNDLARHKNSNPSCISPGNLPPSSRQLVNSLQGTQPPRLSLSHGQLHCKTAPELVDTT